MLMNWKIGGKFQMKFVLSFNLNTRGLLYVETNIGLKEGLKLLQKFLICI